MNPLLIVGASGRAAAQQALRNGFSPTVIDLYADTDTPNAVKCDHWEHALKLAMDLPAMPWMYTGGLENHPRIVDTISTWHVLRGNGGDVLKRVRDPFVLAEAVRSFGSNFPEMGEPDESGEWLLKSRTSAGGMGVSVLLSRSVLLARSASASVTNSLALRANKTDRANKTYSQRFIPGTPVSAAFHNDTLLGTSEQLCGTPWLHAPAWHYAGNIRHESPYREEWKRLGIHLHRHFGLCGPWGLDAIDDGNRLWILELNPRYTASMELYVPDASRAKGIYYAKSSFLVGRAEALRSPTEVATKEASPCVFRRASKTQPDLQEIADIPAVGTLIAQGQPVLTLFADDTDKLNAMARHLDETLYDPQ